MNSQRVNKSILYQIWIVNPCEVSSSHAPEVNLCALRRVCKRVHQSTLILLPGETVRSASILAKDT